jgi:hypothetical protein
MWIVLKRDCTAFGRFWSEEDAKRFVREDNRGKGGLVLWVDWPDERWVGEGCPPDDGAIWFDGEWKCPIVHGPFYDLASAAAYRDECGDGIAIALEMPDGDEPMDCSPELARLIRQALRTC